MKILTKPRLVLRPVQITAGFILNPAVLGESGGQESNLRIRIAGSAEPVAENEAEDGRPASGESEMLRNLPDSLEECAHGLEKTAEGRGLWMYTGGRQGGVMGMGCLVCV